MTTPKPWDAEAMLLKAKLFLNHAMDHGEEHRDFDERALWASLALELLAKAALARVSPVLIAAPNEEGNSLLVASGLVEGDVRFMSVQAKTLFSRCSKAFKPFNDKEAQAIAAARNEYLHGAAPSFTTIPAEAWWPRYWAQAHILIHACDRVLEDIVGNDRVGLVEDYLAKNKRNIEHRLEMLLERARQQLARHDSGQMRAGEAAEWSRYRPGALSAGLHYSTAQTCPACGDAGLLEGEDIDDAQAHHQQVAEDAYDSWMELTIGSSYFSCDRCHLVLDSYELVEASDLPASFDATGEIGDFWEPEYGND